MSLLTCVCVQELSILYLSMIFLLDFWVVPTVRYYLFNLSYFYASTETKVNSLQNIRFCVKTEFRLHLWYLQTILWYSFGKTHQSELCILYIQCSDWIIFITTSIKLMLDRFNTTGQILIYFSCIWYQIVHYIFFLFLIATFCWCSHTIPIIYTFHSFVVLTGIIKHSITFILLWLPVVWSL